MATGQVNWGTVARDAAIGGVIGLTGGAGTSLLASGGTALTLTAAETGAGLTALFIKGQSLVPELGRKVDFLLGKATGNAHNIERSTDMLRQLNRIGLQNTEQTRKYLTDAFTKALNDPNNVLKVQEDGRVVKEFLLSGPNGILKVEAVWDGTKLITAELFGGK
jgi:hypothetical protein